MPLLPSVSTPLTLPEGMRATRAVQALLALLPQQPPQGWTEAAVEAALQERAIHVNRVTVYRALHKLVQAGLLQRSVDAQRLTRYWVAVSPQATPLAHMECKACHQPMALDASAQAVRTALQALRQAVAHNMGLESVAVDVMLQAQCAKCLPSDGAPSSHLSTDSL